MPFSLESDCQSIQAHSPFYLTQPTTCCAKLINKFSSRRKIVAAITDRHAKSARQQLFFCAYSKNYTPLAATCHKNFPTATINKQTKRWKATFVCLKLCHANCIHAQLAHALSVCHHSPPQYWQVNACDIDWKMSECR